MNDRSIRGLLVRNGVVGVAILVAFGLAATTLGPLSAATALRTAGRLLAAAGSETALAQATVEFQVSCTQTAQDVTTHATTIARTTISYAWIQVADPRKVIIERCGFLEVTACPVGATCTIAIPRPICRSAPPMFESGLVFVECSREYATSTLGAPFEVQASQSSAIQRLLIRP